MKYKALNNENDFIVFNAFKHWKLDPADIEVFILSNILPKQIIKEANEDIKNFNAVTIRCKH